STDSLRAAWRRAVGSSGGSSGARSRPMRRAALAPALTQAPCSRASVPASPAPRAALPAGLRGVVLRRRGAGRLAMPAAYTRPTPVRLARLAPLPGTANAHTDRHGLRPLRPHPPDLLAGRPPGPAGPAPAALRGERAGMPGQ